MKDNRNVYCFRLSFIGNYCYFYRVVAYNKNHAYRKMITEIAHDTYLLQQYHLKSIKHIYTIVDSGDTKKLIQGLNIAAQSILHLYIISSGQQYHNIII